MSGPVQRTSGLPAGAATEKDISVVASMILVFMLALLARLLFWAITRWTIEDGLIIARMSRNLAEGSGLVFNEGTRASAATSPLFAAAAGLLCRLGLAPIASAKILGALAGAAGVCVLYQWLRRETAPLLALPGALLYALFPPAVAYSVGGMETSLYTLVCFLALVRSAADRHGEALAWGAAAVVIRPDGLIALAVVGVFAAWAWRTPGTRKRTGWGLAMAAALLGTAVLAHHAYYGTWVPHTMSAKGIAYNVDPWANTVWYLRRMLLSQPYGLPVYALAVIGVLCKRRWRRWTPLIGWYALYHAAFFARAPLFSWYLQPPLIVLAAFAGATIADAATWVHRRFSISPAITGGAVATCIVILSIPAGLIYGSTRRVYQEHEEAVRMAAGAWLNRTARTHDLVFTESLGYVGFYCRNPIVDWPGLAVPEVAPMLESRGLRGRRLAGYREVIREYHPEWLVLRTTEWDRLKASLMGDYQARASFPKNPGPEYVICRRNDAEGMN
jgi:hypothetical protein